ncbi:MAG: serine/threonine protein kinase [Vicinamibacterales bacterium]
MTGESSLFDIPPPKFGRYRVQHQIGAGATGPVFRGEDPDTHAPIVIKALRTYLPAEINPHVVDDLMSVIDRLPSHPAIVPLRFAGLDDQEPYLVSDLASGESLDVALKQFGPGDMADLLPRLKAIAEALDLAAERGLCHAALHPRDVIVSEHSTVITGIGVAEILGRRGTGVPIRRPYTAPEVGRGEPPTLEADQFSLAAIAFEWLFGRPVSGPAYTPLEVPPLPGVDGESLSDAFTTALASEPSARFESCRAFVEGLVAALPRAVSPPAVDELADVSLQVESGATRGWDSLDAPLDLDVSLESTPRPSPSFSSTSMFATELRDKRGFGLGALAATLFLGVTVGLSGGYFASTRIWPTTASAAPRPAAIRPNAAEEARPAQSSPAPDLRPATDVPVAPAPSVTDTETDTPAAETKKERPGVGRSPLFTPVESARVEPGSLMVDSRPPGAAVTVNGVPRGRTPLSFDRVAPGDYIVTMRLTGFRPVTVAVHVAAGERARAAASLVNEQEKE